MPLPPPRVAELSTTALQLDGQATSILDLVRTYLEAGERYSVSLAQAGKNLPTLASPDEIGIIVKFLLAENAKMQNEASSLKKSLEQSKSQIDKLRSHLAEAQEISMRDPLTSLSNRRRFDDRLARELADARERGTPLSLVLADIDNFKKVNDLFGHTIGDEILKMFARVLQDNVCARDTVARYGGEEFAVILPETEVERARQITERMRSQLEGMQLALNASGQADRQDHGLLRHRRAQPGRRCRHAGPARRREALPGQMRRPQPRRRRPGRRLTAPGGRLAPATPRRGAASRHAARALSSLNRL